MAAGLGFKTFNTGDVLTAADVNGYLMQGILVFASAATRDAAITSPQEGQFAYLKDTNVTTYYTGSAWTNIDTIGMTNPMTTTGDTIYSSSGSTPARLGIGTTGQVLTVSGGVPSWANAPGSFSGCFAYSSSDQTIANGVNTFLAWNSESFDVDGYHSTTSNTSRFTIPTGKSGYFLWSMNVNWGTSTTGLRTVEFFKNGTKLVSGTGLDATSSSPGFVFQSPSVVIQLDEGDYVETRVGQSSGGNLDVRNSSFVSIVRLGA